MTTTAVSSSFASIIKNGAELALMYAEGLVKDISPETFAHMPQPNINSAAFNLGHLSIYPDVRILGFLGREDLVKPLPYSADLFKAGAPCVGTPGAYPAKDVIVSTFFARYRAAIEALDGVSDEHFLKPNPVEGRMRELFPTIGGVVNFLFVGHTQSHLGQISVWRRVMGLGSVF
ncbi:MAG: DinB family protein [Phycisphaerae bacterium]|nr:DinB family protein [Phycisphaerae bacterium]